MVAPGGGEGSAWLLGGCMVARGHAWLLPGRGHVWLLPVGGMRGCSGGGMVVLRGVWGCSGGMHGCSGGMHGCSRGACMVAPGGWHVWDTMRYGDTVNGRAVCILLECILVK